MLNVSSSGIYLKPIARLRLLRPAIDASQFDWSIAIAADRANSNRLSLIRPAWRIGFAVNRRALLYDTAKFQRRACELPAARGATFNTAGPSTKAVAG
jgi:hypothetical protein